MNMIPTIWQPMVFMYRSFYIKTMGCQMNEYDSDYLAAHGLYVSILLYKDHGLPDERLRFRYGRPHADQGRMGVCRRPEGRSTGPDQHLLRA
ncbi:hypothetical protein TRIP_B330415 [uncultured Desulfatiglans sp.]|nr:hypothetical protein TRIP_B330415 [uncultured Desulfatiglans sp.]